jgi:hypothetical protein
VLEAAYEATLWAAVLKRHRTTSNIVYLTRVGGGAFGNEPAWIDSALRRALKIVAGVRLDVRLVSYGQPVVYAQTSDGRPLRRPLMPAERERLLEQWYRPHHATLRTAVSAALDARGTCLIIDAHSFPSVHRGRLHRLRRRNSWCR